ncbi:MAG TPA: hypothetical protein DCL43_02875 [Chitinophagaceae bacterium]|nr:hypothetical protein [Chitinophagaceae bacterium]HAN38847.1 hypothetical protein [Chitinophagaceae bacterium]
MPTPHFLWYNGTFIRNDKPIVSANNRSFRYGDGCFETMKIIRGQLVNEALHMQRLFESLASLSFSLPSFFTPTYVAQQIKQLAQKNYHTTLARVRLNVFRGNGGLYDPENHFPNMVIQTWELNPANQLLNENGLVIDIYRKAQKTTDTFANIKSNNYLGYAMAALWAKEQHLNDAIILNHKNTVADTTIANLWCVTDGIVITPPLSDGGVNGVMRKHLLQSIPAAGLTCLEKSITDAMLAKAEAVFLSNSIYGIRWVQSVGDYKYNWGITPVIHESCIMPVWQ